MHGRTFRACANLRVFGRIQGAECPKLLVLDGGRAVWIEHVTFVENGVRHLLGQLAVHAFTSAMRPSICSMVRSQVEKPLRERNWFSFSKTSRRRQIHAVLG